MAKYSLTKIYGIDGEQDLYKLFIDDKCQFDEFEEEIEKRGQYLDELGSIYAIMEDVANNKLLPKTKFRDITISKKSNKEYEFKSKHLRVYATKTQGGKIIILGGYKNRQSKDLKRFRKVKTSYLQSIKDEKR